MSEYLLKNKSGGGSGVNVTRIGTVFYATETRTHNLASEFPDIYQQLILWENIFVCGTNFQYNAGPNVGDGFNLRPSYNATTGRLTVQAVRYSDYSISYRLYVVH